MYSSQTKSKVKQSSAAQRNQTLITTMVTEIRFFFFSDFGHQVSSVMHHHSIKNLNCTLTLTLFSVNLTLKF